VRRVSGADLPALAQRFGQYGRHSFFALQSVHGYSQSELESVFADSPPLLFADEPSQPESLLQLSDIDAKQGQVRVQLCGQPSDGWLQGVTQLLGPFVFTRLYAYVFAEEAREIQALGRAGFQREAVFRQHIYMAGGFRDVHVFGWVDQAT
jgi:hypothetical protein